MNGRLNTGVRSQRIRRVASYMSRRVVHGDSLMIDQLRALNTNGMFEMNQSTFDQRFATRPKNVWKTNSPRIRAVLDNMETISPHMSVFRGFLGCLFSSVDYWRFLHRLLIWAFFHQEMGSTRSESWLIMHPSRYIVYVFPTCFSVISAVRGNSLFMQHVCLEVGNAYIRRIEELPLRCSRQRAWPDLLTSALAWIWLILNESRCASCHVIFAVSYTWSSTYVQWDRCCCHDELNRSRCSWQKANGC